MVRVKLCWEELRVAFGIRAVRFGLLGSLAILVGSLSPAYLPQASPVWGVLRSSGLSGPITKWVGTALTMLGLMLLVEVWLRLRPARRKAKGLLPLRNWAVLVIVALPLLCGPPIFSHDAYSYAAQGWQLHNSINPYDAGPGVLPGAFADQVAWVWRDTPAPYGPIALRGSQLAVMLGGFDPYWSTFLMRIPALIGVALIGWSVPRISRYVGIDPAAASWFVVLNPILIIDFIGGMHNDSLMVGMVLAACWLVLRFKHWWFGAMLIGLAATIKQPAFLAAVALPFLTHPMEIKRPRQFLAGALRSTLSLGLAVATFAALSIATGLDFGWLNAVNVPGLVDTVSPFTIFGHIVQFFLNLAGADTAGATAIVVSRTVGMVVFVVGTSLLAYRLLGKQPLQFVSWAYLLFAFCAPAVHAWYVLWGGALFPVTKPTPRRLRIAIVITVILLGFAAMNFAMLNGPWLMGLLLFVAIAWSLHSHELSQEWEPTAEPAVVTPA